VVVTARVVVTGVVVVLTGVQAQQSIEVTKPLLPIHCGVLLISSVAVHLCTQKHTHLSSITFLKNAAKCDQPIAILVRYFLLYPVRQITRLFTSPLTDSR